MLIRDVIEAITTYDGRHVGALKAVAAQAPLPDAAIATILDQCGSTLPARLVASTWLLKTLAERGQILEGENLARFVGLLDRFQTWEARLHVCQAIRYWRIGPETLEPLLEFVRESLLHKKTLVRVWALDALVHLATQHPHLSDLAVDSLKDAAKERAPSMQARLRQICATNPALAGAAGLL